MKQRDITRASALAIVAALLGCGGDNTTTMTGAPATGAPAAAPSGAATPQAAGGTPAASATAGARASAAPAAGSGVSAAAAASAGTPATAAPSAPSAVGAGGANALATSAGGAAPAAAGAPAGAAGSSSAPGSVESGGAVTNCGQAETADMTKGPGPFKPTHIENGGAGTSWVFYPMELGKDGCKHPIFNWGPGAGTGPSNYLEHLNHVASHGFVIISQPSSGNGTTEKASLEWLIKQNDTMGSPFYQKLDTKKVVMGGHSMGALTTFAMADYAPLTHYILVCGGSFGAPMGAEKIHGPAIILGGDTDMGTPNFEDDYDVIPTSKIFLVKSGTDHIACARNNMEPWVEFMRWQLYGETKWKADFFDGGKFCKAPWDSCKSKGW